MIRLLNVLVISLMFCSVAWSQSSVLATGDWYKLGILKTGLYKIDHDFFTDRLKVDPGKLDPSTIKIFGYGNGPLPQLNSAFRHPDLPENAILGIGVEDGTFDPGDYFLLYGSGPNQLNYSNDGSLSYLMNPYADTTYYFLTYGGDEGKRISNRDNLALPGITIDHFQDHIIHEVDERNLIQSGRYWYGERFRDDGDLTKRFDYQIPGIRDSVHFFMRVAAQAEGRSAFQVLMNDQTIGNVFVEIYQPDEIYTERAKENIGNFTWLNASENLKVSLTFQKGHQYAIGYLDHFILTFERDLKLYDNQTGFRNYKAVGVPSVYKIETNLQDISVWNVTDPFNIKNQLFHSESGSVSFYSSSPELQEFVVFSGSDFESPAYFGKVANQNLKNSGNPDGIIITTNHFRKEAERLANFHREHDEMAVEVVDIRQIYNEFSSGRQDITAIRDYLRHIWSINGKLRYALLFGDCSYDYKYHLKNNPNFIPVYESRNILHPVMSYSSDDYFGFFEGDEGDWTESKSGDHTLEIGIGRLPAKTADEARVFVDKIIRYATSPQTIGKWRNELVYFSDDGDGGEHMTHAETLTAEVSSGFPSYNTKKLYLDAFDQIIQPSRQRSPQATQALIDAIADGAFMINFMGHGNENQWMHEEVLNKEIIRNLSNRQKLPLFVTATCEFGKYDDPKFNSGAEEMLLNADGGAIALLTTTRPVWAHTNLKVNKAFHETAFLKINGEYPRLGDIIKNTKNNSLEGPVNRNFALLGDPMLRLNYPQFDILFDKLALETDTLSALQEITLSGKVVADSQTVISFNGKAIVTVLDIPQEKITKGQQNDPFTYFERSNALFRGEVSVKNGEFMTRFVLPKNMSYKFQHGKITVYAWNDDNAVDATGANTNIVLGGTSPDITPDSQPPGIYAYLNDPSFRDGETVGSSSLLIAEIRDESGINISSGGINQSITLTLNDSDPIILNDYYTADLDSYRNGHLVYPLQSLQPGKYKATLKVWDTHNNSITSTVEFKVSDKPQVRLYSVKNYPNPVQTGAFATFSFEHDRRGEQLDVELSVYDLMGSVVSSQSYSIDNSERLIQLDWNATNPQSSSLDGGVYLYRLQVKSTLDGAHGEFIGRLIIIN